MAQFYPKLSALLQEVHALKQDVSAVDAKALLMDLLVKKHYWPYLQIKYFGNESSLILLHNVYRQNVPISDMELYDECRSVVLDMNAPEGENIILSLSKKIPIRMDVDQFDEIPNDTIRMYEMGYEGTMIYVYYHIDKWYMSTSTCPSVDRSRYFNPNKSHGQMMDEVLQSLFPEIEQVEEQTHTEHSKDLRDKLCANLDTSQTYNFLLVHHENGCLMNANYTELFGANYSMLFHLSSRNRQTMVETFEPVPALETLGIKYTLKFATKSIAKYFIQATQPSIYAVIAHTDSILYKVSSREILEKEEQTHGHPNPWVNLIWIYMQNKPHLRMEDYIQNNPTELQKVADSAGALISPARVVAKVMTTIRDILFSLYRTTTFYYKSTNTYRMNRELDQTLPPILRFHLAQLRHLQITYHNTQPLTRQAIHHYLCHHQTMKNIRLLVDAFTNNHSICPMDTQSADCFTILYRSLRGRQ